jgi:hypothetical protein
MPADASTGMLAWRLRVPRGGPPSGKMLLEVTLIASGKIERCDAYAGPGV